MHIKLHLRPSIWHEKHDAINIKLIFLFTALISVFMVSLGVRNKPFFEPRLYFSKGLFQNIGQEKIKTTTDDFITQQNKPFSGSHIGSYENFKVIQLIEKLNDATPNHQRISLFCFSSQGIEAANALSKLGTAVIEPLIQALNDPRPLIRGNAVLALGKIEDNAATKYIVTLLDDKNPVVRLKTAMALTSIDNPHATAALIAALNDEEVEVRAEAVKALAGRKDPKIRKALHRASNDQSWLVRSEIKALLQ